MHRPDPHCRVRFKRFKATYRKAKRLGPVRALQERLKAERTYELMQADPANFTPLMQKARAAV